MRCWSETMSRLHFAKPSRWRAFWSVIVVAVMCCVIIGIAVYIGFVRTHNDTETTPIGDYVHLFGVCSVFFRADVSADYLVHHHPSHHRRRRAGRVRVQGSHSELFADKPVSTRMNVITDLPTCRRGGRRFPQLRNHLTPNDYRLHQ